MKKFAYSDPNPQLFLVKDEIAAHVKNDLEVEFNQFGYSIIQTLITGVPAVRCYHMSQSGEKIRKLRKN